MKRFLSVLVVVSVLSVLSVPSSADVFNLGPGLTNLETVTVGDPGNQADTEVTWRSVTGYGSVDYEYRIGEYEVTAGQYCEFLNAVAATDTYGLYNVGMADTSLGSGINQYGTSGSYSYKVVADFINRPVNYVSFWDACRFTNWLHNGQPTGAQDLSTTEDGAYLVDGYNGTDGRDIQRKVGARWLIPTDDEWYKAAYYKGGSTDAGYWGYPTRSDNAPGRDMDDASGNNANYGAGWPPSPIDSGKCTTVVGEFQNSASPCGTFDQGGNVWEWSESIYYWPSNPDQPCRDFLGASFSYPVSQLSAHYFVDQNYSTCEDERIGFRIAQAIPEPSSLMILGSGILGLAGMIRRRR